MLERSGTFTSGCSYSANPPSTYFVETPTTDDSSAAISARSESSSLRGVLEEQVTSAPPEDIAAVDGAAAGVGPAEKPTNGAGSIEAATRGPLPAAQDYLSATNAGSPPAASTPSPSTTRKTPIQTPFIKRLRNLLVAFSIHNKAIGYCQVSNSLSFLSSLMEL